MGEGILHPFHVCLGSVERRAHLVQLRFRRDDGVVEISLQLLAAGLNVPYPAGPLRPDLRRLGPGGL